MHGRMRTIVGGILGMVAIALLVGSGAVAAQGSPEADFQKIADAFAAAWAKGDAKGIAALHTKDAVRLSGTGEPAAKGTPAIEAAMAAAHAGPYKGTTLTIKSNGFTRVTADVYVGEGTYQVSGGSIPPGTPTSGQYMNTMVRQGGRWLIAASSVSPAMK
jgi:uncharacterized protein (TIGR02246 family)